MPRRVDPQRLEPALADVPALGIAAAAKKHGLSKTTLHRHCSERGIGTVPNEQTAHATLRAKQLWEERRADMAHRIGATADMALTQTINALEAGNARTAKDAATTMAILVDKAQLLSGGSTQRHGLEGRGEVIDDARDRGIRLVG